MTSGQQMQYLGAAIPLYLLLYTARFTLWALIAARVLGTSLRGRWPVAILAGFVLTMVYIAGFLLLIVGFFVFLHWFLYVPAQLAKGQKSLGAAFEASRRFARERATFGFTALIVLLGSAVVVASFALGGLSGAAGSIAPAIVEWLFGPIVPLLAASYVAVADDAPRAPSPPPSPSPASSARATIKCPQCAALIPYTPTGSPVDVVCPSCGYAGRAL